MTGCQGVLLAAVVRFTVVVAACVLPCLSPARAQRSAELGCVKPGSAAAAVVAMLEQADYHVGCASISFHVNNQGQCGALHAALNPATCYGQYALPAREGHTWSTAYQLDDDEAILTLGTLPPPALYYGYYTYIYNRINLTLTPPAYFSIQAPVGAALNQRNANPGLHARQGGSGYQMFGLPTVILTTANRTTQTDVTKALSFAYGARQIENLLYVEELPVDIMRLGISGTADMLTTAVRVTPNRDQWGNIDRAALRYMQSPPLTILRISPRVRRTGDASVTYTTASDPLPPTKVQPSRVWEKVLLRDAGITDVQAVLNAIASNVIADRANQNEVLIATMQMEAHQGQIGRSCLAAFETGVAAAEADGRPMVIAPSMQCLDASPDAAYFQVQRTVSVFPVGGEIVMIGVNHGTLGSATYSDIAVQRPDQYIAALTNLDLTGTATRFLDQSVPPWAASDFYVTNLSPACTAGSANCLYMPANSDFLVVERAYLAPRTATMPDYTDIIPSVWLIFGPASPAGGVRVSSQ